MARESASIALPLGARLGGVPGACDPPPYTHPAGKPQVVPSWPPNMDASSRDQRTAWLSVPAPPESLTRPAWNRDWRRWSDKRSEEHTSELQSLMRTSYAVFCLKKNKTNTHTTHNLTTSCNLSLHK